MLEREWVVIPTQLVDKDKLEAECFWVYILLCQNNSYYTGYTNNLERRYQAHLNGTASKYTRSFKPVCLAQSWQILGDKSLAMKVERYIKKLSKIEKKALLESPEKLPVLLQL